VNGELAFVVLGLMKVKTWLELEHDFTNLESNWLQLRGKVLTVLHYEAEVIIVNAVNSWFSVIPLLLQELEDVLGNTNVVASSVHDCGHVSSVLGCERWSLTVEEVLSFECPLLNRLGPVWPVGEGLDLLQSLDSSNDLFLVDSSEGCVGFVVHVWSGYTETYDCLIDNTLVLKIPNVVEVSLFDVWMNGKTKNAINIIETFSLVEGQEIELGAGCFVSVNAH